MPMDQVLNELDVVLIAVFLEAKGGFGAKARLIQNLALPRLTALFSRWPVGTSCFQRQSGN